jgi:Zn-dependent protease
MPSFLVNLFQIVVLIYSVVLHEVAHGLVARSMGDRTAEDMGRLTLNPFKHLDLFGSFILPLLSQLTMGFMFGYAKPVPYNPNNLSDRVYGPAKVALAGPLTNLTLAGVATIAMRLAGPALLGQMFTGLLGYIVWINLALAIFNLMPVPPLDGHWLLMTFLPARFYHLKVAIFRYQWLLLAVFLFFIFPLILPLIARFFTLLTGTRIL